MAKNLRVGLVGLGMMGRNHSRVLASLPEVDYVGVCDTAGDPHALSQGRALCGSVAELIELGIDYAVVAVPTIHHLEVCKELANSGIHALVEKPLSQNTATAKELMKTFVDAGLVGAVGHIERYNPALQEARQRLHQLGSLYQVVTRRQGPYPARVVDIGVIKDLATHDIDLTAWITRQKYASVSARTALRTNRNHEDLVAVVGSLVDGTVTNHLVNWLAHLRSASQF
jgi:UDP-N-acetylglucosamine 3-dehydrogenase